ncbi:MAG: hypothetical protein HY245_03965 [Rhizobiales bacterium]|nr:hypothetical protein [Hyphomicrobiales bacterium]MBI3672578.1 hypothetical protein [Hyphomicrobiales bacterium]
MKHIDTYSLHQAGNVTRRIASLPGASELPKVLVTVEHGADLGDVAERLRRIAAVFERHAARHEAG